MISGEGPELEATTVNTRWMTSPVLDNAGLSRLSSVPRFAVARSDP